MIGWGAGGGRRGSETEVYIIMTDLVLMAEVDAPEDLKDVPPGRVLVQPARVVLKLVWTRESATQLLGFICHAFESTVPIVQSCQVWPFRGPKTNVAFFKNWLDSKFLHNLLISWPYFRSIKVSIVKSKMLPFLKQRLAFFSYKHMATLLQTAPSHPTTIHHYNLAQQQRRRDDGCVRKKKNPGLICVWRK